MRGGKKISGIIMPPKRPGTSRTKKRQQETSSDIIRGRRAALENWTTSTYREIQSFRRNMKGMNMKNLEKPSASAFRTNRAIAQFMRDSGIKTPVIPMYINKSPKFLYRGIHGYQADDFKEYGSLDEWAYLSFSRSLAIAQSFAEPDGVVLRLDISKLPHGIPWIWFSDSPSHCNTRTRRRDVVKSSCPEAEVLFPPGVTSLVRKVRGNMYDVSYYPYLKSKSLEGKNIVRRVGEAKRDIHHKPDNYERSVSNMFSKMFS